MFARFHGLTAFRIRRHEDQRSVHCQGEASSEEEGHGDHMRGVVVERRELVADHTHPVEVAHDPVGKSMAPCAEKEGSDNDQRDVGEDRESKSKWHMKPHAKFSGDFDLPQHPGTKRTACKNGNHLPKTAIIHGSEAKAIA